MNPRATIALLVFTLLAVGGLVWLGRVAPGTRDAAESRRYAAVFDPEDITEIDIARGDETVSLRRSGDSWNITAPVQDRADPEAVDRLISALRFLAVRDRRTPPDEAAVAEAGLAAPRFRVDLRGAESLRIDIGGNTAMPHELFARSGAKSDILRVPDTIAELAGAPVESFRDPRLTASVSDDIEKFTVRRADGQMTVRRERGEWFIEKPVSAPADPFAVRGFLEPLLGMRVVKFGASAPEATSLPGQTAEISMTPRGGGEDLNLEVMRGADDKAGTVVARFAPRGGLLEVDAAAMRVFDISPEALRDRSLGYAEPDTVDRISVQSGRQTLDLRREGDGWSDRASGRKFGNAQVDELFRSFNAARAVTFEPGTTAAAAGLQPAAKRLLFAAWLSENSAEDAAGGHTIAGAELGNGTGGTIYARRIGGEDIVTVPADLGGVLDRFFAEPAATAR